MVVIRRTVSKPGEEPTGSIRRRVAAPRPPIRIWTYDIYGGFKFWFFVEPRKDEKETEKAAIEKAREMNRSPEYPWLVDTGRIFFISTENSREYIPITRRRELKH